MEEINRGRALFNLNMFDKDEFEWHKDTLLLTTDLYEGMLDCIISRKFDEGTAVLCWPEQPFISMLEEFLGYKVSVVTYVMSDPVVLVSDIKTLKDLFNQHRDEITRSRVVKYIDKFKRDVFSFITIEYYLDPIGNLGLKYVSDEESFEWASNVFASTEGWSNYLPFITTDILNMYADSISTQIAQSQSDTIEMRYPYIGFIKMINTFSGSKTDLKLPDEPLNIFDCRKYVFKINREDAKEVMSRYPYIANLIDQERIYRYRRIADDIRFCRYNHIGPLESELEPIKDSLKLELQKLSIVNDDLSPR